ncbi:AraC family transcriptional regulator [Burkholderia lata]|uniref:helix-turn-helix domain-containing protein n=1 Tax=Burkholderia lata (strain ATCC 17760 / DSM 23089 / LMG 22485 / NCIMB 9086 / R18194 / 383) TaxID=482957 RepID=UPI001452A9FE|nr:helix-turn-helix domain-containing protein [Burkholderia lata]VWC76060.1 AraC family transcriptional regulator [Burkholderia lata]
MTSDESARFDALARSILGAIGGASNVRRHFHCMTRLRLVLVDPDRADVAALKALPAVLGVVPGEPLQIVIGPAMSAIHADPGHAWSVSDLAELSNLSRSAFADRFQRVVGQAPLSYLTTWRLDRAAELLRYSRAPISDIAGRVGYTSEAAFSRAFRGRYEMSPMQWRKVNTE